MRRGDTEFFVSLEDGEVKFDKRFQEVSRSNMPPAPYFEKTMQLSSGAKVKVSGFVDPYNKAKSRQLKFAVSRRGGLDEKDVDEMSKVILDLGLEITAAGTKNPGILQDKLNNLLKYSQHRKKEELAERNNENTVKKELLQQVEEWQVKHKGYLGIGIVKEILKEKGGLNEKLDELKKDPNPGARAHAKK